MPILESYKKSSLLKALKTKLLFYKMVHKKDKILVAVSGGSDSIALLYCLKILSRDLNIYIGVVHLNHMLRGINSEWDTIFVKFISYKLSIPFYSRSVRIKKISKSLNISIEEAGRKIRYIYFRNVMKKNNFSKVALAQHMDDNSESILMSLFRGSSISGLTGISFIYNKIFIRPFTFVKKSQVLEFLIDNKIIHIEDKSNKNLKYTRNRIRNKLLPFIASYFNPNIIESLNKISNIAYIENKFIDKIVEFEYRRAIVYYKKKLIIMSINVLNSIHTSIRRRIIRKAFYILFSSTKGVRFEYINNILNLIDGSNRNKNKMFFNIIKVTRSYNKLKLNRTHKENVTYYDSKFCFSLNNKIIKKSLFPLTLQNNYYSFTFSIISKFEKNMLGKFIGKSIVFFDLEMLSFPINIRFCNHKDKFNAFGTDHYKKISRFFIDKKIPINERKNVLIIQSDNKIIWVIMHEICNHAKVSKFTKNVLMIKFCLLKI